MKIQMRIAIIDNYDSFTWNLFHYLEPLADEVKVFRYDEADLEKLAHFDRIVISPGPGMPSDYPKLKDIILDLGKTKPILGVCLGHQAIAEAFGGNLENLKNVWHGIVKKTHIIDKTESLFVGLPKIIETGHYHSWVVKKEKIPECIKITAEDENGVIMAISHKEYDIKGLQFHPESVMTLQGKKMLENWLT
jgi:anthranilate synthase component 2